ncbi:uncharacterized protein LOC135684750 [Rhopilema esculentum]|uniref:uncharacterized protein LOC135684750 n=1 Tax=Rhopilema esculentum TaxID=499914 RepID=UPI0031D20C59
MAVDKKTGLQKFNLSFVSVTVIALLVAETIYLHLRIFKTESILTERIDELRTRQQITEQKCEGFPNRDDKQKQEDINYYRLYLKGEIRNIEQRKIRSKRNIDAKIDSILQALKSPPHYILQPWEREHGIGRKCRNVTLVCQKGERGARGKSGPRGAKGDIGETGAVGPVGMVGPRGHKGERGLKGEPGLPGRSISKPNIKSRFPIKILKKEATTFTLVCEANGNPPPKMFWTFGEQRPDSRYAFPMTGALTIVNITENDNGRITCVAENVLGNDTMKTELSVLTKPRVFLNAKKVIRTVGFPLEIKCNATGNPVPKLSWKKSHGVLRGRAGLSADSKSITYNLTKPFFADAGYYICEATNDIGITRQSVLLELQPRDCSSLRKSGQKASGIYTINPDNGVPFSVYCDMTNEGGGWTVIQRRTDGSVDFFQNWELYKAGFGVLAKEFWLGNENIHRLTKQKDMMIRFDLEDVDGKRVFAEYSTFYIDGQEKQYTLHVSSYSGTAGDSFSGHNGQRFSTKDKDNDIWGKNCATEFHGAWWYGQCHSSNLNGKYLNGPHNSHANGVNWYAFKGHNNSLKRTIMKVRPR